MIHETTPSTPSGWRQSREASLCQWGERAWLGKESRSVWKSGSATGRQNRAVGVQWRGEPDKCLGLCWHYGWPCGCGLSFTLDVGIARRNGKSGWYFFGIPKSNIRSNLDQKKHFNWSFRTNFSHLNAVQRVDAHVQEDTIQNLRMRSSKSHKLLFKYRHGNLGKDGRHEGWEANQDENHNMGHPGSAQVVVFHVISDGPR